MNSTVSLVQEKLITKNDFPSFSSGDTITVYYEIREGDKVKAGQILVKIPKDAGKTRDITGGLPRIAELFEARNPSNPAIVSEIDGVVSFGKIKRGNREIIIEAKTGEVRKYLIKLSNQILVQENDFVKAGTPMSEGSITPNDILNCLLYTSPSPRD